MNDLRPPPQHGDKEISDRQCEAEDTTRHDFPARPPLKRWTHQIDSFRIMLRGAAPKAGQTIDCNRPAARLKLGSKARKMSLGSPGA